MIWRIYPLQHLLCMFISALQLKVLVQAFEICLKSTQLISPQFLPTLRIVCVDVNRPSPFDFLAKVLV